MKSRTLGNTGLPVSEIGLGCWQLGGADWGDLSDQDAFSILGAAVDNGITFIDTADVYGDGRSEKLIGRFLDSRSEELIVATKIGRKNYPGPYTREIMRQHIQEGCERLGVEAPDLLQLHCVPADVMADGEIFEHLREFRSEGIIKYFGASVESMDEALAIVDQPQLASLQVIFNIFRQKPAEVLFDRAQSLGVGIIVRLPLASGLLAGKFAADSKFAETDHRNYNRNGDAFNVGETFAGLPFSTGLSLTEKIKPLVPQSMAMAQFSQRWILDHAAVSTVITGASRVEQVVDNALASDMAELSAETHRNLRALYEDEVLPEIRGVY